MPQLQGSRFEPELGLLSVWSCSCSPCVRVSFLPLSAPLQIDYTKLPVVDNVCVCVRGAVQWTDIPSSLNSPTLCAVFTGRGSRVVTQHEWMYATLQMKDVYILYEVVYSIMCDD